MTEPTQNRIAQNFLTVDRPAVICGNKVFSYKDFFSAVLGAENHFKNTGIQPNDRIGISSPNSVEYILTLFALWHLGAVPCLLSTRLPDDTRDEYLQTIKCRRVLNSENLSELLKLLKKTEVDTPQEFLIPLDQDATIIFTSGTCAKPKAVLQTYGNHYYNALGSNEHLPVVPGDQWLLSLPLYHVGGLGILFRTFLGGGTVVLPENKSDLSKTLKTHKITHVSLVPTQLIRLLRDDSCHNALKNLKVILLGGSAIPHSLIDDAVRYGLPIYTTYGMTEMSSQIATSNRLSQDNSKSEGKILNYRRLMISEEGEIIVGGKTLFKGYVIGDQIDSPFNENGYFETGDLGEFSDNGHLQVSGRKDNMFISGGENIQPEEIEQRLCQMKEVERAVVIPVMHEEFGMRPQAFIKSTTALTREKIINHLRGQLPKFKIPDEFFVWPAGDYTDRLKDNRQEFIHAVNHLRPSLTQIK